MTDPKDPPPARELPEFTRNGVTYCLMLEEPSGGLHGRADVDDLKACLAHLPEAERAELLAPYIAAQHEAVDAIVHDARVSALTVRIPNALGLGRPNRSEDE